VWPATVRSLPRTPSDVPGLNPSSTPPSSRSALPEHLHEGRCPQCVCRSRLARSLVLGPDNVYLWSFQSLSRRTLRVCLRSPKSCRTLQRASKPAATPSRMSRCGSCFRPARLRESLNARRSVLTLYDDWTRVWRLSADTLTCCGGSQASKLQGATIFFSDSSHGPGQSFLGKWFRTKLKKAVFGSLTSDRALVSPRTLLSSRRRNARRRLASARCCSGVDG
jgi:hypothetical protein